MQATVNITLKHVLTSWIKVETVKFPQVITLMDYLAEAMDILLTQELKIKNRLI